MKHKKVNQKIFMLPDGTWEKVNKKFPCFPCGARKKGITKIAVVLGLLVALMSFAVFVMADTQEELQEELEQLEQELTDANYSWLINYSGNVSGIFYEDYFCNETGYETSKVITEGVHDLEFDFGGIKAYAHNLATAGGTTTIIHTSFDDFYTGTFTNGTFANGSTASSSDGNIKMVEPGEPSDKDASMVLWMHFNNDSAYCYDNETEILTEDGWKYFYELKNEKVATLNQETGELEWQLPYEKQVFEYDGDMFRIKLKDERDLLVSPEHKIYVKIKDKESNSIIPFLLTIFFGLFCFRKGMKKGGRRK